MDILDLGSNFTAIDWAIVVAYMIGTIAIGIYANRYVANMSDYIVAGRSLNSAIGIATMIGSEIGLVTVMYNAQMGFTGGFSAFHVGLMAGVGALVVGLTGFIVVPLRHMGVMTIPEFYDKRFGRGVRVIGGLILAAAGILNMGVFLKAGAIFLTGLTGLNDPFYVNLVMTVLIIIVLGYTILGGMLSVVITDYLQFVVLSFGLLFTCVWAIQVLGWDSIVDSVKTIHGSKGFNPFEGYGTPYVVEQFIVAGFVSSCVWPTSVMRACAMKDTASVRRLYIWSSIGFMTRFLIPMFLGICAMVFLFQNETANAFLFADGQVVDNSQKTLQAMPVFLSQILPVGLIGIIGAGMLAAFMSTHDSYLLCWSSVIVEDVVNPIFSCKLSDKVRIGLARFFIFAIGAFLLIWSLWYPLLLNMWDYLVATATIYSSGALALLIGGIYWKRASRFGAYLALFSGAFAVLALPAVRDSIGLTEDVLGFELTKSYVVLGTMALSLVLMVVGSLVWPDKPKPDAPAGGFPVQEVSHG